MRNQIYALLKCPQASVITDQLNNMNVPVHNIVDLMEEVVVDFLDLESREDDDDDDTDE